MTIFEALKNMIDINRKLRKTAMELGGQYQCSPGIQFFHVGGAAHRRFLFQKMSVDELVRRLPPVTLDEKTFSDQFFGTPFTIADLPAGPFVSRVNNGTEVAAWITELDGVLFTVNVENPEDHYHLKFLPEKKVLRDFMGTPQNMLFLPSMPFWPISDYNEERAVKAEEIILDSKKLLERISFPYTPRFSVLTASDKKWVIDMDQRITIEEIVRIRKEIDGLEIEEAYKRSMGAVFVIEMDPTLDLTISTSAYERGQSAPYFRILSKKKDEKPFYFGID
jgi:hypothetical protein